jgi:hypothetical protein
MPFRSGIGAALLAALLAPALARADAELDQVKSELVRTRAELARTQDALAELSRRVDSLTGGAAAPVAALAEPGTARIPPVNANNPAISFVVDAQGRSDTEDEGAGFLLGSGELFISAPIDPFLRGFATLNGTSEEDFDIEEAALATTALPWNLNVKGGRFFADVGRLSHWHDEALPFVDRPESLDRIVSGESQGEGVEVSWLAPTPFFLQLTGGVFNSIGAERREEPDAFGAVEERRSFSELTWLTRPVTYFDLTDTFNVEAGGTYAFRPGDARRNLWGADFTLRHQPGTSGFYQGTVLGAEWLWNDEEFVDVDLGEVDPGTGEPILSSGDFTRQGGYVYVESFFNRRYSAGLRFDYAEALFGDMDLQRTYTAFLTWQPSEFQRLRVQFDHLDVEAPDSNQRFTVQWTAFLGSHAHGFQSR